MYIMLKHLHQTSITLTFVLFLIAFVATMMDAPLAKKKWLKITPHILYTIVLITAVAIWFTMGSQAYELNWLISKIIGFLLYVLSISFALKWARNNAMRIVGLLSAIAWLGVTASIAISKSSLF
ncbi:SirB2 family protein [Glaciecola sp. 1036]|uniref:SirB2 family protein n=1 Tax=Alteromonadaceae TaxID=72275 RepID=UPI003D05BE60